ncbi:hypothetical protein C8R43DRAFT_1129853 [Mycena crocata]|nr:hypothetical protein C8R43DRAFT_1129853 [Mycena crocata]
MGDSLIPLWSLKAGVLWCSINDNPSKIPPKANDYIKMSLPVLPKETSIEFIKDFDYMIRPVYYHSEEHWLGYIPTKATVPLEDDALGFIFDPEPVDTMSIYTDVYTNNDDEPQPENVLVGYKISEVWTDLACVMARRLHAICYSLAVSTDFYGRDSWNGIMGDMPEAMDETKLERIHWNDEEAQQAVGNAKRSIMSLVGFLSWFQTVKQITASDLDASDRAFVGSLRLKERPKTGFLFNLGKDMHEINLPHLANHDVPFHFAWTDSEKASPRFRRLGPEYWNELAQAREWSGGREVDVSELVSYERWKEDLERFDIYFQDGRAGKRGEVIEGFLPTWIYRIVDFRLYGARTLTNRNVIRAYSERFRATVHSTPGGDVICTFFRQNPLKEDEPPMLRDWPVNHEHELEDFTTELRGEAIEENEAFFESTSVIREQVKNKFAPRPGRTFNSYNGRRDGLVTGNAPPFDLSQDEVRLDDGANISLSAEEFNAALPFASTAASAPSLLSRLGPRSEENLSPPMSPTRRSAQTEDEGISSRWAREIASSTKRRSSLSPQGRGGVKKGKKRARSVARSVTLSFDEEFDAVSKSDEAEEGEYEDALENSPLLLSSPVHSGPSRERFDAAPERNGSSTASYTPRFETRAQAVEAIRAWAPTVVELDAVLPEDAGLQWSLAWLVGSILVCEDSRSYWRMKAFAACAQHQVVLEDVLEFAMRSGMRFALYVKSSEVRKYADHDIPAVVRNTVEAMYAPGYVDTLLTYGHGGEALYRQYVVQMNALVRRPHAVAFIGLGGIMAFVATKFDPDLPRRFARGPSIQVTEFLKGDTILCVDGDDECHYTADQVSSSEEAMLLGLIPSGPMTDATLWPSREVLESESAHFSGYTSAGCLAMFENLWKDLTKEKKFIWRTRAGWKEYFKRGNKGTYAPQVIPKAKDFAKGEKLFQRSFPINWELAKVAALKFPEEFVPTSLS